jgi:ribonuclease HI
MQRPEMRGRDQRLILRTDGASRGNPGPAAAGIVIQMEDGTDLVREGRYLGLMTNNQAEYRALILGLTIAATLHPAAVEVRMDSELVVKQMRGEYAVKSPDLLPLHQQAWALAGQLPQVAFVHVRRAANAVADALANRALDEHQRGQR